MVALFAGAAAYLFIGVGVTTGLWCSAIAHGFRFPGWWARIGIIVAWPVAIRMALEEADE